MLTSPVTRVEISRSRLIANFKFLRSLLTVSDTQKHVHEIAATTDLLAVVKANAYGHGLSPCAPWLVQAGAKWLGITSVEEGVALRRLCPKVRILVMRGLMHDEANALIDAQLIPTVWEPQQLAWLADAAQKHKLALGTVPIHLEIDSGMSRQGVGLADLANLLHNLQISPHPAPLRHLHSLRLRRHARCRSESTSARRLSKSSRPDLRCWLSSAMDSCWKFFHPPRRAASPPRNSPHQTRRKKSHPSRHCALRIRSQIFRNPIPPPRKQPARICNPSSPGKLPSLPPDPSRPELPSATTPPSSAQHPCGLRCSPLAMPTD